jgi:hypothetical protein
MTGPEVAAVLEALARIRVLAALLDDGAVVGGDGVHRIDTYGEDRPSAPGRDVSYELMRRAASACHVSG